MLVQVRFLLEVLNKLINNNKITTINLMSRTYHKPKSESWKNKRSFTNDYADNGHYSSSNKRQERRKNKISIYDY